MFGRNPRLLIDVLIENNTDEQNATSTYIEKWKRKMKEAIGMAAANTKWRRDMNEIKSDQKARLQSLEVDGWVLVRKLNEKGGSGKTRTTETESVKNPWKERWRWCSPCSPRGKQPTCTGKSPAPQ